MTAPVRNDGSSGIDQIGIDVEQRDLRALGGEGVGFIIPPGALMRSASTLEVGLKRA
jgi:hypothetical protein